MHKHNNRTNSPSTTSLTTTSANSAFSTNTATRLSIADPVIKTLDARARGEDINIGKSPVMGMPKRAYGFANGHLTLKPGDATSTGTINGSGSVGTGSYLGSVGTSSVAPGVNGKSPYAGVDIWGTHLTGAGIQIKERAATSYNRKQ